MIEMQIPVEVPEDRCVTFRLPADVPTGFVRLTVIIESVLESPPATIPEPIRAFPPRPLHPKLAAEFDAFQRLLPALLASHRDSFIAIHHGQVVEVGLDRGTVLTRAYQKTGDPMVYVERVTDQPQVLPRSGVVRERWKGAAG